MTRCDLEKLFGALADQLPEQPEHLQSGVRTLVLTYDQKQGWNLIHSYDKRPHQYTYEVEPIQDLLMYTEQPTHYPPWLLPLVALSDKNNVKGPCDS
jgi:hypothetical protein